MTADLQPAESGSPGERWLLWREGGRGGFSRAAPPPPKSPEVATLHGPRRLGALRGEGGKPLPSLPPTWPPLPPPPCPPHPISSAPPTLFMAGEGGWARGCPWASSTGGGRCGSLAAPSSASSPRPSASRPSPRRTRAAAPRRLPPPGGRRPLPPRRRRRPRRPPLPASFYLTHRARRQAAGVARMRTPADRPPPRCLSRGCVGSCCQRPLPLGGCARSPLSPPPSSRNAIGHDREGAGRESLDALSNATPTALDPEVWATASGSTRTGVFVLRGERGGGTGRARACVLAPPARGILGGVVHRLQGRSLSLSLRAGVNSIQNQQGGFKASVSVFLLAISRRNFAAFPPFIPKLAHGKWLSASWNINPPR